MLENDIFLHLHACSLQFRAKNVRELESRIVCVFVSIRCQLLKRLRPSLKLTITYFMIWPIAIKASYVIFTTLLPRFLLASLCHAAAFQLCVKILVSNVS